jgi:ribonuclease H / adenosylcobalamin/alpha-ribazole phosphatase
VIEQLILVRHGETLHNVARIAQGWGDSELSERGARQVAALGERIVSFKPDAIYSSPLQRALTTASAISEKTGLSVNVIDELREMNYGSWEGRSFVDVRKTDEDSYHRWIEDADFACPDGESHNVVLERMKRAFEKVRSKRPVLVTHGTAIRIGATALLNVPLAVSRQLAQDNASINVFQWRADRFVLKVWNDTTHCSEG